MGIFEVPPASCIGNRDQGARCHDRAGRKLKEKGAIGTQTQTRSKQDRTLVDLVVTSLEDDKAQSITVIDLTGKSTLADFMVIASGTSARHLSAVSDHLVERLKAGNAAKAVVDGKDQGDWVLIDAGDIIVHLFRPEVREFYNLEKLWGTGSPGTAASADTPVDQVLGSAG